MRFTGSTGRFEEVQGFRVEGSGLCSLDVRVHGVGLRAASELEITEVEVFTIRA